MPKKFSSKEKEEIVKEFVNGSTIDNLSKKFNCTKVTITRHLKKSIDPEKYKNIVNINDKNKESKLKIQLDQEVDNAHTEDLLQEELNTNSEFLDQSFLELVPLDHSIDDAPQKDLASISITEIDFPKIVYLVVDKKIELEIKYLKEYPEWQFLSQEELNRKTIEIFYDIKVAKRICNKDQKVIKVPNTEVFQIAAPYLLNKGISRIVSGDKLIAL